LLVSVRRSEVGSPSGAHASLLHMAHKLLVAVPEAAGRRIEARGALSSALVPARARARSLANDAHAIAPAGRTPSSSSRGETAVGSASYRLLLSTYTNLVNKVGSVSAERIALSKLSSWITESRLTGLALIEGDRIALGNARFHQLGKILHRAGRWIS